MVAQKVDFVLCGFGRDGGKEECTWWHKKLTLYYVDLVVMVARRFVWSL